MLRDAYRHVLEEFMPRLVQIVAWWTSVGALVESNEPNWMLIVYAFWETCWPLSLLESKRRLIIPLMI